MNKPRLLSAHEGWVYRSLQKFTLRYRIIAAIRSGILCYWCLKVTVTADHGDDSDGDQTGEANAEQNTEDETAASPI